MSFFEFWHQVPALIILILLSAFFAISETGLMRANRHRLQHLSNSGRRTATLAVSLQAETDHLLSIILIGNTLVNALVAVWVTGNAIDWYGNSRHVLFGSIAVAAALIIVCAEIVPKSIAAAFPEAAARWTAPLLRPMLSIGRPLAVGVDLFLRGLLRVLHFNIRSDKQKEALTVDELRLLMTETSSRMSKKHQSILKNLFDLENISVDDVMTRRNKIRAIDLALPDITWRLQLTQAEYDVIPVCDGDINQLLGVLPVRRALGLVGRGEALTVASVRALLLPAYFVPQDTDVLSQLQYFQENRERVGMVVNEYGDIQGLITVEDILEEMIGEYTVSRHTAKGAHAPLRWDEKRSCTLPGSTTLRDVNRALALNFPLDGAKTLNGYILDQLQEIPEYCLCLTTPECHLEIRQLDGQSIQSVTITHIDQVMQPELL